MGCVGVCVSKYDPQMALVLLFSRNKVNRVPNTKTHTYTYTDIHASVSVCVCVMITPAAGPWAVVLLMGILFMVV